MAYEAFKDSGSAAKPLSQPSRPYFSLYRKGIVMNILNPKVSLFFLALLPQFVNQQANSSALQMLILEGVFILQAFLIFSAISFFAGKIAFYVVENHALARKFNLAKALLLALIGLQIAFSDQ